MSALLQWEFTFYLTSTAVARRISLQTLFRVSTMWVLAVLSPWPLLCCAIKATYREGKRLLGHVLSSHHCWSDSLYLPLHEHVASSSSKDSTNWFNILLYIYTYTKELPSNNHILLSTLGYKHAKTWEQNLYYLLLRDFWCCPCPLSRVSATKNPRDAETHSEKHQLGSSESTSTFPKAGRFTYLPQLSMQKAWRHLVPVSPALPSVTSTAPQAWVSRTSNHQPPRRVFWLGRAHPNPTSYILSPSWRGNFGSLHLQLYFCPAVGNMPLQQSLISLKYFWERLLPRDRAWEGWPGVLHPTPLLLPTQGSAAGTEPNPLL